MSNFKKTVPVRFYNKKLSGQPIPTVTNVGELKQQLADLPDDLPVVDCAGNVMGLTVYNVACGKNTHLYFDVEEPDYFE